MTKHKHIEHRGGAREGAGRPRLAPLGTHKAMFTLTPEHDAIIESWCAGPGARRSRSAALRYILEQIGPKGDDPDDHTEE